MMNNKKVNRNRKTTPTELVKDSLRIACDRNIIDHDQHIKLFEIMYHD